MAWTASFDDERRVRIFAGTSIVIVDTIGDAIVARRADDGEVAWTSDVRAATAIAFGDALAFIAHDQHVSALAESSGESAWRLELPSPAIHLSAFPGGLLVTTTDELLAYRVIDGELVWRAGLAAPPVSAGAASDAAVFVMTGDRRLRAFDRRTGRPLWTQTIVSAPDALVTSGSRVYFGTATGTVCAFDAASGRQDWCFDLGATLIGTPLVDDERVHAVLLSNAVYSLDLSTGNLRRRSEIAARPAAAPGFVGARIVVPVDDGGLVSVDPATGRARLALAPAENPAPGERMTLEMAAFGTGGDRLYRLTRSIVGGYSLAAVEPVKASADGKDLRY